MLIDVGSLLEYISNMDYFRENMFATDFVPINCHNDLEDVTLLRPDILTISKPPSITMHEVAAGGEVLRYIQSLLSVIGSRIDFLRCQAIFSSICLS